MERLDLFSECLKDLLAEREVSVLLLSHSTHIEQSRIYDYLNKKHAPSLLNACRIANFFHCSLDFLFGFEQYCNAQGYDLHNLCANVKDVIDNSGVSRYRLSKMGGFSQSQLARWYNGVQHPTLVSLLVLAECLDCTLDCII